MRPGTGSKTQHSSVECDYNTGISPMYLILFKFLSVWIPNKIINIKRENYQVASIPEIIQQTLGESMQAN